MTALFRLCSDCGRETSPERPPAPGTVRYGANGRCQACDKRVMRKLISPNPADPHEPTPGSVRAKAGDVWPVRP